MKRSLRDILLRYGITVLLGAGMVWLILDLHGYAALTSDLQRVRLLCDAFTIPGTVLLMMGLLVLISASGAYDGLSYVLNWLKLTLLPFGRQERYYNHVQRRRERKKLKGGFLIITGAAFLAVAVVLMIVYYRLK